MNFKKHARDKRNQIINEGDILQLTADKLGVVTRVLRFGRDQVPELKVTIINSDFLGRVSGTERTTADYRTYREWHKLELWHIIRDDVPKFQKAKELRESVLTQDPK